MSLRCIIVDDERSALKIIHDYCLQTEDLELIGEFTSPIKALKFLDTKEVDLVFLDINMPRLTGLQLPEVLKNPPMIIYTTAYSEYAAKSYDKEAIDYLLKPIAFGRFLSGVRKALEKKELKPYNDSPDQNEKSLYVKSGNQLHQINVNAILFLEKQGHYVTFHTKGKKVYSRLSLNQAFESLNSSEFVQVHKSYIIALQHVDIIESSEVIINGLSIPIGKSYKKRFFEEQQKRVIGS